MAEVEREIPETQCRILVKSFYVGNSTEFLHFGVAALRVMDRITHQDNTELITEVINQCSTLENLVADGFRKQVLDLFSSHITQPGVSWEQIIMYYVYILRRPSDSSKDKCLAYQYFLKLIKNSERLFFFLKMTSNINLDENSIVKKKPHFGGGLKKAVIKWYLSKSLPELLLDVWLMPRVYSWTHVDVLKLLHWKIDTLGDEFIEHKMFVQYCMVRDYKKGKREFINTYTDVEEVEFFFDVIKHRMMLQPEEREDYSLLPDVKLVAEDHKYPLIKHCDQIIHHENLQVLIQNLVEESVFFLCQETFFIKKICPSEDDSEEQIADKKNICQRLIEELIRVKDMTNVPALDILIFKNAYIKAVKIYCDGHEMKKKWLGGEAFPSVVTPGPFKGLYKPQNVPMSPPKKLGEFSPSYMVAVSDQLNKNILHQAKRASIAANHPGLIVVCNVTPRMKNYVPTHPGIKIQKQMRGMQAIVLMMYSFCHNAADESNDGLGDRALVLTDGKNTSPYPAETHCDIYKHCMALFNLMRKPFDYTFDETLKSLFMNWSINRKDANTVVFIVEQVSPEIIESSQSELAKEQNNHIKKFVLLGMYRDQEGETTKLAISSRMLVLNGFHSRTISIIESFIEGRF